MKNKCMDYDEMMFLVKMKRKAKVEFENNLWKQRFEELNGESFNEDNIIMPYSENDYLVKQNSILINEIKQKQDDRFID